MESELFEWYKKECYKIFEWLEFAIKMELELNIKLIEIEIEFEIEIQIKIQIEFKCFKDSPITII